MEQEEAGEGAGGDGQRVDGGHHQHPVSTYFYSIVLSLTGILKTSCFNSASSNIKTWQLTLFSHEQGCCYTECRIPYILSFTKESSFQETPNQPLGDKLNI